MATLSSAEIRINDGPPVHGELSIDREIITIRSEIATKPDPTWEYIDSAGHFHACSTRAESDLPTLNRRTEHVDCDGSCGGVCEGEGYTVTRFSCAICGEDIEPGRIPFHEETISGPESWNITVHTAVPYGERVSVRIVMGGRLWFGIGLATDLTVIRSLHNTTATTTIVGAGPLGERKSSTHAAVANA